MFRIAFLLLAGLAAMHCAASPVSTPPASPALEYDYEVIEVYRAARVLRGVSFKGGQSYRDQFRGGFVHTTESLRFSKSGKHLSIRIHGENRRGRIIDLDADRPDALSGRYWIETWKPMAYASFESGPPRVEFRTFQLMWNVRKVASSEFKGRILRMRVLDEKGRLESHSPVPALKIYILKETPSPY